MRNFFYWLTIINLISFSLTAQTFHDINITTPGTYPIGGINVTITKIGNAGTGNPCCTTTMPYHIGANGSGNAYKYSFSSPVNTIRMRFCQISPQEKIKIKINNADYVLTGPNLSTFCNPNLPGINGLGQLENSGGNEAYAQVDIDYPTAFIDSIKVEHLNGINNGAFYDIAFAMDTPVVFQHPLLDTMLCAGDSLYVKYIVNSTFNPSNTFTVQLSNALGSFSPATNIGTINSNASGTVACRIPVNTPSGKNYRIRLRASSPSYIVTHTKDIQIDRFAFPPSAIGNDSLCEGYELKLETRYFVPGINIDWKGPDGFTSNTPNPSIPNLTLAKSGDYILTASIGACEVIDTVKVDVQINPPIRSITNNGPLCEKDSLYITVTDTFGLPIKYKWTGPTGFSDTSKNPIIYDVYKKDSGIFVLNSTLGFCYSTASTSVEINTKPANLTISSNSPILPGNELRLTSSSSTPGITYYWVGPDTFSSTEQNPVIPQAPVAAKGTYTVTATIGNCQTSATTVVVVQNSNGNNFTIFPNPTTGTITIRGIVTDDQDIPLVVGDVTGSIIYEDNIKTFKKLVNKTITLPGYLPSGNYFMKMKVGNDFKSYTIVIKK